MSSRPSQLSIDFSFCRHTIIGSAASCKVSANQHEMVGVKLRCAVTLLIQVLMFGRGLAAAKGVTYSTSQQIVRCKWLAGG
ncbi:MAG TPA: hypothetical protein PKJ85_10690 [Nitrosomonas nitrosa]|nr:hypothetical protein [Nitrosomonas nitrosa]